MIISLPIILYDRRREVVGMSVCTTASRTRRRGTQKLPPLFEVDVYSTRNQSPFKAVSIKWYWSIIWLGHYYCCNNLDHARESEAWRYGCIALLRGLVQPTAAYYLQSTVYTSANSKYTASIVCEWMIPVALFSFPRMMMSILVIECNTSSSRVHHGYTKTWTP